MRCVKVTGRAHPTAPTAHEVGKHPDIVNSHILREDSLLAWL